MSIHNFSNPLKMMSIWTFAEALGISISRAENFLYDDEIALLDLEKNNSQEDFIELAKDRYRTYNHYVNSFYD